MNRPRYWKVRIALGLALAAILFVVGLVGLVWWSDDRVARIVDQLQPGMADGAVQQLLTPVRYYKGKSPAGNDAYVFYGIDEFVTVVMEKDGNEERIARVDHDPDRGPYWDRMRRSWERRAR
jgi:hypothetical protein